MDQKKLAIIVAGGKGLRMGGDIPKQFMVIEGMPLLMRTIAAFARYDKDLRIILVLPKDHQAYWKNLCQEYHFTLPYTLANGGATRFESVKNGLALIDDEENSLVAVHDGVRPFVNEETIAAAFQKAAETGAAIPVTDSVDSLRQLTEDGGSIALERKNIKLVQTPQVFQTRLLKKAYEQPYRESFTDDASVVEALGAQITLTPGNRENIKITTPFDLSIAQMLLKEKDK